MRHRPLHWNEGMLVLPHHFQAFEADMAERVAKSRDWTAGYAYGLRRLRIEADALAAFHFRVSELQARLRDGTLLSIPGNGHLGMLDLKPALAEANETYLHLAIPETVSGRPVADRPGTAVDGDAARFTVRLQEWEDQSRGGNARELEVRSYNAVLLARPDLTAPLGYESIPVAKVVRGVDDNAAPKLDPHYIPPLLACDAWTPLLRDVLGAIEAQFSSFIDSQADYLRTHGGWSEANQPQVRRAIMHLQAVNGCHPYLGQLAGARGVSPWLAYAELCRFVGQLSLFRRDWRPPQLPAYDHDDLGRIFRNVKIELERCLGGETTDTKVQRFPFQVVQDWLEVDLKPEWTRGGHGLFVAVRSELNPELLEVLFSDRWLDWKLGSTRTIDQIYRNAEPGLKLQRVVGVHPVLPVLGGVTYFRVDGSGPYWEQVVDDRSLALKVNDRYVREAKAGQNTLTVVDPKQAARDLALELFVVDP